MQTICMNRQCKLPVNGFGWVKDILSIDKKLKTFIKLMKNYDEDSDIGYILELDFKYPNNFHDLHRHLPFVPERMKINSCNKIICNLYDKKTMLFT